MIFPTSLAYPCMMLRSFCSRSNIFAGLNNKRKCGPSLFSFPQERFLRTTSKDIAEIRERLRSYGSTNDHVTLQLASDTSLSTLGSSTAIITLSNPSSRNALTGKMMAELADAVNELESQEDAKAVVVRGSDNFFCAGADLSVAKQHLISRQGGHDMGTLMMDTLQRLQRLPLISVALIEGMAIGGGAELCTAMDYRIMHQDAKIQFVHAKMGLSPGWGGARRLVQLVGKARALTLLGTSQACTVQECLEMGLVDKKTAAVESTTVEFLDQFMHSEVQVLRGIKTVVAHAEDDDDNGDKEQEVFQSLWGGTANRNALKRVQNKTKPTEGE